MSQDTLAAGPVDQRTCRACGSHQLDRFCAACGHPIRTRRRTLRDIVQSAVGGFFSGDMKTLRSIGALLVSPGALARDAIEDRGRLVDPVKVFFAVIIVFTLFYTLLPYQFAQLEFVTVEEYGFANPDLAPSAGVQPRFLLFAPQQETLISPGVSAMIASQPADQLLASGDIWNALLVIAEAPLAEAELAYFLNTVMAYAPLCTILPILLVNGLIHRRRRFIMDHVLVSFEAASTTLILIMLVQLAVAAAALFGVQWWTTSLAGPFLFGLVPAYFAALLLIDRRVYRTNWIGWLPKSLVILIIWIVLILLITAFSMIHALGAYG